MDEKYLSSEKKEYYHEFLNRVPDYSCEEVNCLPVIKPAESWIR